MHHVTRESLAVYLQEIKRLKLPVFHVPGNHDTGSTEACTAYGELIGDRFYAADLPDPDYRLIVLDSFVWMKDPDSEQSLEMNAFLEQELLDARVRKQQIIMASHSPLFQEDPDEGEDYFNLPVPCRKYLLDLLKNHPVRLFLSGHTHRAFSCTWNGILFSSSETTGVAFDRLNCGFRRFLIKDELIQYRTIPIL